MKGTDKPTSRGSKQRLAMLGSGKRYRAREKGEEDPLYYGTIADARRALS